MRMVYILSLVLASISTTILIFLLSKRATNSAIISTFIVLLLLILFWAVPQIILASVTLPETTYALIDKISGFGYVFIPVAFSIFTLAYTDMLKRAVQLWFILYVYVLAIVFLFFAWNTDLIEQHSHGSIVSTNWGVHTKVGDLFPLIVVWFESIIIFSMIPLIRHYRKILDPVQKRQTLLLIIAMLIPLSFGTITNGLFPILHIMIMPIAIPLTSIMALIIAYAIMKYGLFEMSSQTILSSLGSGIITLNKEKKIMQINDSALDTFGVEAKEIVGQHFDTLFKLRRQPPVYGVFSKESPLISVLNTGKQTTSRNYFLNFKNKKRFAVEFTISPIIASKKSIVGLTIMFHDISREKELEKSKNEFIGIASHELKTPLTAVIGFSQIFERQLHKEGNANHIHFIKTINDQLIKMKDLVEDLLNVSRLETGEFVVRKKPSNIDELIEKVVNDFQGDNTTHRIVRQGKSKVKISLDAEKIRQVITNLISNAIKYSPDANKVILVVEEQKNSIIIRVQDFGIGIPKKDEHKIFQRFYRTSISQHSTISGFGLGLYISNAIVRGHKGKMWVDSTEGKGSTFSFSLPKK